MSARGARSRKAVVKDIEKKEKKVAQKGKAPEAIRRPGDAFAEWNSAGTRSGVPTKKASTPAPPLFRAESSLNYPSNPDQKSWMNFRIWQGGNEGMRPYGGFDFDEDLQDGNVLIYFTEEQIDEDRPLPQIRAELDVLENCGSTWLNNALLYGRIDDNDDWTLEDSAESSRQSFTPHFPLPPGQRQMLAPVSPGGMSSPPPFNINQTYYGVPRYSDDSRAQYYPGNARPDAMSPPPSFRASQQQRATHELWFTAPRHLKTPQAQRLHHVAVRNFIAILHDKPMVGADLFEMLNTLQPEIQVMYDLDHDEHSKLTSRERSVQTITNYLTQHKLDDVRNGIKLAISLLTWAEQDNVRWRQGYLESFVHLAGILNPQVEEHPDFKRLSIATRRNLGIAAKSLQLRVMEAEERLGTFDFDDVWPNVAKAAGTPVYQSCQAFRQFLINYLTKIYGNWPPSQGQTWLNRKIALDLQRDFGMLYDYLVNRDVVWDVREERPGNKWQMANLKTEDFRANLPELSLSDILVTWDNKHGYSHIPHAYPLLPRDVPQTRLAQKKGLFGGLKKSKIDATKDAKTHLQLSIVFSDATNIEKLDSSFGGNILIDSFEQFELSADLKATTPREARLGRWVLLYGILQVLSTLSVDVQSLKHTDGVRYFLCTDLKRCPEWVTNGQTELLEASQQRTWCWQRPWDPTPIKGEPVELEASTPPPTEELDSTTLDGATMMNNEIRHLGEKIDNIGVARAESRSAADRKLVARREGQKMIQGEFASQKMEQSYRDQSYRDQSYRDQSYRDQSYRIRESDYDTRPLVPDRSPLRSPGGTVLDVPRYQGRERIRSNASELYPMSPQDYPVRASSRTQAENFPYDEERRGWR
ncbi:uncharacterized protein N0V89_002966 [Didymosphaeria variabile]|uniref:DUF8004 domain-containing protein n=1 Tax=Didymosphaeria variabile TaxID=1932322 RepID=A0A9W8XTM1_9PLEO|nr:uncharacterized protein N0V89_002966 [Didymosphaeria variabile]KAJ4358384.1 hypothetical protein N0V89_002966 [Didymosphaeria variabile]